MNSLSQRIVLMEKTLIEKIEDKDYDIVKTRDDLLKSNSDKIYGSFAP